MHEFDLIFISFKLSVRPNTRNSIDLHVWMATAHAATERNCRWMSLSDICNDF